MASRPPTGRPQLLIDQYYQLAPKDYRNVIRRGSLANVPAVFLVEELQILKIDYEDPDRPGISTSSSSNRVLIHSTITR